jgi:hypothetical protein
MPRRGHVQVSLFPFMSILACTIGALMFLLVTLALSRVEATGVLSESLVDSARTAATIEDERVEVARLEKKAEELERIRDALAALDRELTEKRLGAGISLVGIRDLLERRTQSTSLADEIAALESERERIRRARGEIETSIDVLESRRETLPILIDPTGLSRRQIPYFVECDAGGATAYRVQDGFEYFVPRGDLSTAGDFGRYLRRIRALPNALLVLLVREDGIATANQVERIAKNAGIRSAQLPLPGKGELDFSLLRKAEGGSS